MPTMKPGPTRNVQSLIAASAKGRSGSAPEASYRSVDTGRDVAARKGFVLPEDREQNDGGPMFAMMRRTPATPPRRMRLSSPDPVI